MTEEQVLVVPRQEIFVKGAWQGILAAGLEPYQDVLSQSSFFMPRARVEDDPGYQQVIPYIIFRHGERYLLTQRLTASSEPRLRQLYSLGIGGHINPPDGARGDLVAEGLRREWEEEVHYEGRFEPRLIGLLNDDSNPVSEVHLGVVFLVEGDSEISVRETEKLAGELLSMEAIGARYSHLETWSQVVYDHLVGV